MKNISGKSLCTRQTLRDDFQSLGIRSGSSVILHSSLSSLGFVVGGAETVIAALLDVVGDSGTLVVPTHTSDNSDPAMWSNPPVPETWWPIIRESQPGYDPIITPSMRMGKISDVLRTWPGARRSAHPQGSFAALGAKAQHITANHALDSALGEDSPLAKLEELDAQVLLLGTGFDKCTAFHLAEYRVGRPKIDNSFAIMTEKGREWITVQDIDLNSSSFVELGQAYERTHPDRVQQKKIGDAQCRLLLLADAVRFAETWLRERDNKATN